MGVIQEQTITIDGKRYRTRPFTADVGLVLMPRVLSLLSPNVAKILFGTNEAEKTALVADPAIMASIAIDIAREAAKTDGLLVLRDLMEHTVCENGRVGDVDMEIDVRERFGDHFACDYLHMFKVALWVARVSFARPSSANG